MGDYSKLAENHEPEIQALALSPETQAELNTGSDGLSSEEVILRFQRDGPNLLPEKREKSCLWYLGYLWGPIPLMIWAAITFEILRDAWVSFFVLLILQFINGIMKWYQDRGSRTSIKKLKTSLLPQTYVKREGRCEQVASKDLVIGDRIKIKIGDIAPADLVLCEGSCEFDLSSISGESFPVKKGEGQVVYQGSICKKGEMEAIVLATGIRTFLYKSKQKFTVKSEKTSFEKANFWISVSLLIVSTMLVGVILAVVLVRGNDILESLSICTVLLVASIPIAMQLVCTTVLAVGANTMASKKTIVARLNSIEKLAGMNLLCVKKTGMLTRNDLTAQQPVLLRRYTIEDIFLSAGLASKRTPGSQDPIDKCITEYATQKCRINFQAYDELEFIPFDSKKKRCEVLVQNTRTGDRFKCTKGSPQIILAMAQDPEIENEVTKQVEELSVRGYRAIGVARTNKDGKWSMIGLIPLYDPPREDAKDSIEKAFQMQIGIKLVTGDQMAISKETAKLLNLGDKIYHGEIVCFDTTEEQKENLDSVLDHADGFAEVFPEHKYIIVKLLQEKGYKVGVMGSNVNDVAALKKADVGIAVYGALDAAKSASDIILTYPGLSVIMAAVHEARKTFQRLNNYYTYRIACTLQLLLFFATTMILINPSKKHCNQGDCDKVPNTFALPVISLVIITVLNDGTIISIAYDNVAANTKPYKLSLSMILWNSLILGIIPYVSSVALLLMAIGHMDTNHPNRILKFFGIGALNYGEILTMMYLKVSLSDYLTVFAARTSDWFWSSKPTKLLMFSAAVAILIATLLSVYWFLHYFEWTDEKSDFPSMKPIGWGTAGFVWGYNIVFFIFQDLIKVFIHKQQQVRSQNENYYLSSGVVDENFLVFTGSVQSKNSIVTKRSMIAANED
ncbi:unnamed protein product [Blepharisma stoltei]|uniref:Plasma membrane ATPase n=1 Tax=Blepharisma stoltei TaxID=1481888 RepID=A0AAU9J9D0_9CILI|nr:unnamed protein product [Blepharisma stoltei]